MKTEEPFASQKPENAIDGDVKDEPEQSPLLEWLLLVESLGGNKEIAEDLLQDYRDQAKSLVNVGAEAVDKEEWSLASSQFHRLAGSSFAIRAQRIALLAQSLEILIDDETRDVEKIQDSVAKIKEAQEAFEDHLKER